MIWIDAMRRMQNIKENFDGTLSSSNEDLQRRFCAD